MKFNIKNKEYLKLCRKYKQCKEKVEWHETFAWTPVAIKESRDGTEYRWLQKVMTRIEYDQLDGALKVEKKVYMCPEEMFEKKLSGEYVEDSEIERQRRLINRHFGSRGITVEKTEKEREDEGKLHELKKLKYPHQQDYQQLLKLLGEKYKDKDDPF